MKNHLLYSEIDLSRYFLLPECRFIKDPLKKKTQWPADP